MLTLILIISCLNFVKCVYFHEHSAVLFNAESGATESFGFSMSYQNKNGDPKLFVGAPQEDLIGKIYSCNLNSITPRKKCTSVDIDVKKLAPFERDVNPNQNFFMGAALATTSKLLLTCAPLWTKNRPWPDVYGTCFINNGTSHRYKGFYERFEDNYVTRAPWYKGGVGWNLLADEKNGFILIAKTAEQTSINYLNLDKPFEYARSIMKENAKDNFFTDMLNTGYGLVSGKFFSNETVYAFNAEFFDRKGMILFIEKNNEKLKIMKRTFKKPYKIQDENIGSMFGHSLFAVDVNLDQLDELLVGAPSWSDDSDYKEYGAVHIYMGGDLESLEKLNRKRTIVGVKEEGRFGSAISAADIDGDLKSEIFISAPYEDSGIVYVLSGHELNQVLCSQTVFKQIELSELKNTQRIQRAEFYQFGFSLQRVHDIDNNGCDELAVGVPGNGTVLLLRCLPVVNVTVSAELIGAKVVREQDKSFKVGVCVNIDYKGEVVGKLLVTNAVIGYKAIIPNPIYTIDLSSNRGYHCTNVTVILDHHESYTYIFTTKVGLDNLENLLESREFNPKWIVLSPYSETERSIKITRDCRGDDCNPKLSVEVQWSGSEVYTIGQSDTEQIKFVVKNEGHTANDGCLKIKINSPITATTSCEVSDSTYVCALPPVKRNAQQEVNMVLNMNRLTNLDKELSIFYDLYDNCYQKPVQNETFNVKYNLPLDGLEITGKSNPLMITEKEMMDPNTMITVDHVYLIENKCKFSWNRLKAVVNIAKDSIIDNVKVFKESLRCLPKDKPEDIIYECVIDIEPGKMLKILASIEISKDSLDQYIGQGWKTVDINSILSLQLTPDKVEVARLNSSVTFKKELTVGNNKGMIIMISVIVAIVVLIIITLILYKIGFFKRKEKKRLNELRQTVRRRSIRIASESRESQKRSNTMSNAEDNHGMDFNIEDDCAFEDITSTSGRFTKEKAI